MQSSSSLQIFPSTPSRSSRPSFNAPYAAAPLTSSPLAPSSSSPTKSHSVTNSERRRAQYKSHSHVQSPPSSPTEVLSSGKRAMLREKFKRRYRARAAEVRERSVKEKRRAVAGDVEESMEDVERDEDVMQDELYTRVVLNQNQRQQRAYRASYANEVGSSFDLEKWEEELRAGEETQELPPDLDPDELEAYAEEYAALADMEGIPEEELFGFSDIEVERRSENPGAGDMDTS